MEGISPGPGFPSGWRYSERAHDLARFTPDPFDGSLQAFVEASSRLDASSLSHIRARLTESDAYTLLLFARRQAVRSLRARDQHMAVIAVTALTLVDRDRVDHRDLSPDFPLFTVRELGASVEAVLKSAIESSSETTARVFEAARPRVARLTLADCALVEVHTVHGLGVMDSSTGTTKTYDRTSRLAERAVDLSDRLDREGTYVTRDLAVSGLPGVWFTTGRRHGDLPVDGCVSIHCERRGSPRWSHGMLVFLAKTPTPAEADQLARRARDSSTIGRPRVAISSQELLAVFVGGSTTTGEAALETQESMERFCNVADAAMSKPSARSTDQ